MADKRKPKIGTNPEVHPGMFRKDTTTRSHPDTHDRERVTGNKIIDEALQHEKACQPKK